MSKPIEIINSELLSRIEAAQTLLDSARGILGDGHREDCQTVQSWIDECRSDLGNPPPVSVALLGSTGAGKSTLINSLIGASVLPTSSVAVCTSSITRVKYRPGSKFSAHVELVPVDTWEKQLQQASADIAASKEGDIEQASYVSTSPVPEDEAKRIKAIYGAAAYDSFLSTGDRSLLVEPDSVRLAFEAETIHFECDTTEQLRQEVARYLTSNDVFWPIVRTCLIEGPFSSLDHGAELVDLPGLNDPNEAREELTRTFLETARFVWVVFNMKRSLGKDLTQVLESRDLLNRLLAGGRLSSLTFIGTHSDDVSSSNPEDFALDDEASSAEIALARNMFAEDELRNNLQMISRSLTPGGAHSSSSTELAEQLIKSAVFMVSASNYLQMTGVTKSRVPVIFDDPYETNVPQLANHLRRVSVEAGPRANALSVITSIEEVVAELASLAQGLKTRQLLLAQEGNKAKEAFLQDVSQSAQVLHDDATGSVGRLRRSLQEAASKFKAGAAIDKGVVDRIIANESSEWSQLHWATMRATSSRGGRYSSPTFGEIDLIQRLSKPVISKAMDPWKAFFEKDLVSLTSQATDGLRRAVETYGARLNSAGSENEQLRPILADLLPDLVADVTDSVESALALAQKKLSDEILRRQQDLHSVTENAIAKAMESVFSKAAAERGTGMKARMVHTLESGSRVAVGKAIDQVQLKLSDLADLATSSILDGISPVVHRIDERSKRIVQLLAESAPTTDMATIEEIDRFLSQVTSTREIVSKVIEFESPTILNAPSPIPQAAEQALVLPASVTAQPVIIDASNVARSPSAPPDVTMLDSCRLAAQEFFAPRPVILIADASLPRIVENQSGPDQLRLLYEMISNQDLVVVPPGVHGKADKFILNTATSKQGTVVSNDSYKEFQSDFAWLFDEGRLFGHTFHDVLGWQFTPRYPVKRRTY
jgi:hypothetical protein